jgi:DNA-binding transcriptional LysR family regulator
MDKLAALQAFVRVVDAGSFVRAAEQLGTSTTSVSRLVAELETALGSRLLQRTTRRSSLTAAGTEYFQRAQQILAALEEADAAAGLEASQPSGHLRVSAPVAFGTLHLAPLLCEFHARHPAVRLDIALSDRVVDLVEEGFDAAIRIAAHLGPTLVARRLCTVRMVACAAPSYLEHHGAPRAPGDLTRCACLVYTLSPNPDDWRFESADGALHVRVESALRSNHGELLRQAALAGHGITVLPTFMVGADLGAGRLAVVLPRFRIPALAAHAVYPTRRHLPAKVRAFVDLMAEKLSDPPPWDAWTSAIAATIRSRGRAAGRRPKTR